MWVLSTPNVPLSSQLGRIAALGFGHACVGQTWIQSPSLLSPENAEARGVLTCPFRRGQDSGPWNQVGWNPATYQSCDLKQLSSPLRPQSSRLEDGSGVGPPSWGWRANSVDHARGPPWPDVDELLSTRLSLRLVITPPQYCSREGGDRSLPGIFSPVERSL